MNDYYTILSVGRQATTAEIANAYRQLLIRERQEKGDQADFGLYSQAYRTLTNHGKRIEYDKFLDELSGKYVLKSQDSPTEAEKCYLAGLTCMEQKNFQDAVDYLYRAVQLEPEQSHFCSQLGLALGMFKDRLSEAERYCKKAISLEPDNPDFHFNIGFLYQRHNLTDAAQSAFDHANQAIKRREERMVGGQILITPWEQQGQDLLEELTRLESMVDGPAAAPPAVPPVVRQPEPAAAVPDDLVTGSDLLRQLDELESQVSKTELTEALAATAGQSEGPMEPFLNDDLLKELDMLEAQVRGVEELHHDEAGPPPEPEPVSTVAEPEKAAELETVAKPTAQPEVVSPLGETAPAEESEERAEARAAHAPEESILPAGERELNLTEAQTVLPEGTAAAKPAEAAPAEKPAAVPEARPSPVPAPEPARETAVPAATDTLAALAQFIGTEGKPEAVRAEVAAAEPAPQESPVQSLPEEPVPATAAEPAPIASEKPPTGAASEPYFFGLPFPRELAENRVRMLEELEREMLEELEMVRREKEKMAALR